MKIIAGIDYSLTCPAICVFASYKDNEKFSFNACSVYFLTEVKRYTQTYRSNIFGQSFIDWETQEERYESIADWAEEKTLPCDQIALEGYAYNATGRVFHIAENTGVLKYKLWKAGKPLEVIPPTTIKQFATGKGNASKEAMYRDFVLETGVDLKTMITPRKSKVESPVSDIVDSYYICKYLHSSLEEASSSS